MEPPLKSTVPSAILIKNTKSVALSPIIKFTNLFGLAGGGNGGLPHPYSARRTSASAFSLIGPDSLMAFRSTRVCGSACKIAF